MRRRSTDGRIRNRHLRSATLDERNLLRRQFLCPRGTAQLADGVGVPPGAQVGCTRAAEEHHESLRIRVDLKLVIRAPVRGGRLPSHKPLQDAPKAVVLGVEDPPAVTGVEDQVLHVTMVGNQAVSGLAV